MIFYLSGEEIMAISRHNRNWKSFSRLIGRTKKDFMSTKPFNMLVSCFVIDWSLWKKFFFTMRNALINYWITYNRSQHFPAPAFPDFLASELNYRIICVMSTETDVPFLIIKIKKHHKLSDFPPAVSCDCVWVGGWLISPPQIAINVKTDDRCLFEHCQPTNHHQGLFVRTKHDVLYGKLYNKLMKTKHILLP